MLLVVGMLALSVGLLVAVFADARRRGRNGAAWVFAMCLAPAGLAWFAVVWAMDLHRGRPGLVDPRGLPRALQAAYVGALLAILVAVMLSAFARKVPVEPLPDGRGLTETEYLCGTAISVAAQDPLGEYWIAKGFEDDLARTQAQWATTRARCLSKASTRLGASVMLLLFALIAVVAASQGTLRRSRESDVPLVDAHS